MNHETIDQAFTFILQYIDRAKPLFQLLKDLGLSKESIFCGVVVGLVFFLVYLILRSIVELFQHFFDFLHLILKSVVKLFKHFFDFLQTLTYVGPLVFLIWFHCPTSNLGQNQQFALALIAIFLFGIITVCLILKRTEERPIEMTKVQTIAARVQTDAVGVQRDVAGVQADAVGVQRDAVGVQRDVAGVQADAVGVQTDVAEIQTDAARVQ
ncbi:hypothetical protein OCU04_010657 [Sclerotinia nivalis]|uniref:Uncharacterized protein n=1 Tax=Sclerotinia nivalis TaxID=352851 RepID=A0A9X0ADR8_9HELO|nr:hypothetical protein OCU04_010657 [Sclerotinia nivalis]